MKTINYTLRNFQDKALDHPGVRSFNCEYTNDDAALLFALYIGQLGNMVPGKFDGASLIDFEDGTEPFVRVVCGNDGKGSPGAFVKDIAINKLV